MTVAGWLAVGAVVLFAGALAHHGLERTRTRRRSQYAPPREPHRAPRQAAYGLALLLLVLALGTGLLRDKPRRAPEQHGVGVVVEGLKPYPGRTLAVSLGVKVTSCHDPVDVKLIVSGTVEFWQDNAARLEDTDARLHVSVPGRLLEGERVTLGQDGKTAAVAPLDEPDDQDGLAIQALAPAPTGPVTVLSASIRHWGEHLRPVIFHFSADWLQSRSRLGSCYLRLPALAGPTTVLSAQISRNQAREPGMDLPPPPNLYRVSSLKPALTAYYRAELETTEGVSSVSLGKYAIRDELSTPKPDTSIRGRPSWVCSTKPPLHPKYLDPGRGGGRPPAVIQGRNETAAGAISRARLAQEVGTSNCATYAVLESSDASVRRDVTSLFIGVLFSAAIGLLTQGVRRRRRDEA